VYARSIARTASLVIAATVAFSTCGHHTSADHAQLCQDLTNLQATVAFLAAPGPEATVGDVRGALDKLDSTWQTVHDDPDVPDDEDDALLNSQDVYRDLIEGIGDDDVFAPHIAETAGVAQALMRSYQAVRVRLVCSASLQPG
jgi:hypothetical protein